MVRKDDKTEYIQICGYNKYIKNTIQLNPYTRKEKHKMKKIFKKILSSVLLVIFIITINSTLLFADALETSNGDIVILYTNDTHCAISGYSYLAACKQKILDAGNSLLIVDIGDAVQGEAVGTLTNGGAAIDLMNMVGYRLATPGNHEFGYGMDTFISNVQSAVFKYLSCNLIDLLENKEMLQPYSIEEIDGKKVGFIGISTPETYTKTSPKYFQNENGELIYSFSEDNFYETIQNTVNEIETLGADYIVALGHLGIEGTTNGWKSTDVITNTYGIDVFLDGHSHETIASLAVDNKNGDKVILSSTGTKFENIGKLVLDNKGEIHTELIKTESIDINSTTSIQEAYKNIQNKVDEYNRQTQYLNEVIGESKVNLEVNDSETGIRRVRNRETNLGDFVADAYKIRTNSDISLVNSGGIRAAVLKGNITRKSLLDVNPWNNTMCVIEATGQQIIDALEHGARNYPEENGGFLQVSGITFEINTKVENSPVIINEKGAFQSIDEKSQRRIQNVKVNGQPIDLNKSYTVAGSSYVLMEAGDGFTMFEGSKILVDKEKESDSDMLISYLMENLNGLVPDNIYGNELGAGRIILTDKYVEQDIEENLENTTRTNVETNIESSTKTPSSVNTGDYEDKYVAVLYILALSSIVICLAGKNIRKYNK